MTLDTLLLLGLQALLITYPIAAWILVRAAIRRPRILSLTLMATLTVLIALIVLVYVFAIANSAAEFPVPQETVRILFRVVLLFIGLFPVWFLYLYYTRRFSR